jgi:hypothetical protein
MWPSMTGSSLISCKVNWRNYVVRQKRKSSRKNRKRQTTETQRHRDDSRNCDRRTRKVSMRSRLRVNEAWMGSVFWTAAASDARRRFGSVVKEENREPLLAIGVKAPSPRGTAVPRSVGAVQREPGTALRKCPISRDLRSIVDLFHLLLFAQASSASLCLCGWLFGEALRCL